LDRRSGHGREGVAGRTRRARDDQPVGSERGQVRRTISTSMRQTRASEPRATAISFSAKNVSPASSRPPGWIVAWSAIRSSILKSPSTSWARTASRPCVSTSRENRPCQGSPEQRHIDIGHARAARRKVPSPPRTTRAQFRAADRRVPELAGRGRPVRDAAQLAPTLGRSRSSRAASLVGCRRSHALSFIPGPAPRTWSATPRQVGGSAVESDEPCGTTSSEEELAVAGRSGQRRCDGVCAASGRGRGIASHRFEGLEVDLRIADHPVRTCFRPPRTAA